MDAKKLKLIVKGERKPTFGTDPNEPWSVRAGITESEKGMLHDYLKSRGINPDFVGKDTKISHAKSAEFHKWKRDHMFDDPINYVSTVAADKMKKLRAQREEVEIEEMKTLKLTPVEMRQKALNRAKRLTSVVSHNGLHKEEQLDEVSPETLTSYILKTSGKDPKRAEPRKKATSKLAKIMAKRPVDPKAPRYSTNIGEGFDDHEEIAKELIRRHGMNVTKDHLKALENERDSRGALDHDAVMAKVRAMGAMTEAKKPTALDKFRKASAEREKKHAEIEKQSKEKPDMKGAIDRLEKHLNKEAADAGISKAKETSFHKKLDKLVHSTFGKRKDEMKMKEEALDEITQADIDKSAEDEVAHAKKLGWKVENGYHHRTYDHPKHGHIDMNRYGEWQHRPKAKITGVGHGDLIAHGQFKDLDKHLSSLKEEVELIEKNDSHTHAAHYEDPKTGEWTGMNLLIAKDDDDAIRQAQEKCKEGCRLTKVERHTTVKEEAEQIDELNYDTVKSLYKKRRDDFHGNQVGKKKKGKEVSAKNVSRSISRLMGSKPTQKEEVEQIDELKQSTLASYKDKSTASLKNAQANRDAAEAGKHMSKGFADLHAKSDAIAKKRVKGLIGYMQRKQGMKPTSEDVFQDTQAATQTAFDMGTQADDREPTYSKKKEMSKSARMIKAIYKKNRMVKEEIYDHEKEDKSVATYGKKPKVEKQEVYDDDSQAAMVLKGGKTLTGQDRDTLEIDPVMRKPNKNSNNQTDK